MKRGVWIAACIIGVIAFGAGAVFQGYIAFLAVDAGAAFTVRSIEGPVIFILIAGACAAGIFLSPREIAEVTQDEVDDDPAQWIKDMRRGPNDPP